MEMRKGFTFLKHDFKFLKLYQSVVCQSVSTSIYSKLKLHSFFLGFSSAGNLFGGFKFLFSYYFIVLWLYSGPFHTGLFMAHPCFRLLLAELFINSVYIVRFTLLPWENDKRPEYLTPELPRFQKPWNCHWGYFYPLSQQEISRNK